MSHFIFRNFTEDWLRFSLPVGMFLLKFGGWAPDAFKVEELPINAAVIQPRFEDRDKFKSSAPR